MSRLIECARCGGLQREDSACCPHCRCAPRGFRARLGRWIAVVAPGLLVACGPLFTQPTPLYGAIFHPPDAGDGSHYTATDAYGALPFPDDAGPDGGDAGD